MANFNNRRTKYPAWVQYVLLGLGILVAIKLYKIYHDASKTGAKIAADVKNSTQAAGIKDALNQSGVMDVRADEVIEIADNIYVAFYKTSFWGLGEDEEAAVEAFNSLQNVAEAKACARIYKVNYKKTLSVDIYNYCNGSHWKNVKQYLYNAIKGI